MRLSQILSLYQDTYHGGTIQYPTETANMNELMEEFQSDLRAMEGKLDEIIAKFAKKHLEERISFKENPTDVPSNHLKWIKEQRRLGEEKREMQRRAAVPESNVAGRSDEGISYVMEEDENEMIADLPGMADVWAIHHEDKLKDERKKQELEENRDPFPEAISAPSGENVVYVDVIDRTRGRRPGNRGRGGGKPPVA